MGDRGALPPGVTARGLEGGSGRTERGDDAWIAKVDTVGRAGQGRRPGVYADGGGEGGGRGQKGTTIRGMLTVLGEVEVR